MISKAYKHDGKTLAALNDTYWYLRDGDLLPEKISMFCGGRGVTIFPELDMLEETGNLFATREEAMAASTAVRAFLLGLRHE